MEEIKSIKRRYRFRPKKRLGQHFIRDRGVIHRIITRSDFRQSDHVLEIGAGLGALTIPLAGFVHKIIAVEKDSLLVDMLDKKLSHAGITNVTLINDDILKLDLKGIADLLGKKIKTIGNLPYNISSPFLEKLFKYRNLISKAVLMFQSEFAKRLLSPPGGKEYGAITVLIQYNAAVSPLLEVAKEAFYPRPKVDSMVLAIDLERPYPKRAKDDTSFKAVVKGAFAHRRKTIQNSLKGTLQSHSSHEISVALRRCDIDPRRRAETLDIDDFLCLADALKHG
ncbi:16S rRNA (adenine(1518)-N(6)/adenine(1519)-N(6))-dimethyltransferase RsmA [Thermodesulfobacteriota bacterium]